MYVNLLFQFCIVIRLCQQVWVGWGDFLIFCIICVIIIGFCVFERKEIVVVGQLVMLNDLFDYLINRLDF